MGIVSRVFTKKKPEIEKIKEVVSEAVHEDKNQFGGSAVNSQNRINTVIEKTDALQEDFRNSIAYKIAIRTGRRTI